MIGDPLIDQVHPVTPPGVTHPNPAIETMRRLAIGFAIVVTVAAFVWWFRSVSPDDDWCAREVTCPTTPEG